MTRGTIMRTAIGDSLAERNLLWVGLLTAASVVLSGVYACATPFAALATLAALDIERRDGLVLVGAIWLANQIVGFVFLGYPHELQAYAWGLAIGAGAVAAYLVARWSLAAVSPRSSVLAVAAALVAAFIAYEGVLYAASFVLPGGASAFSLEIVGQIAATNAVAFAVLLVAHRIAVAAGVARRNVVEASGTLPAPQQA
jgi:hypothetical protein